jgi:Cu/Ag efflux pump CusA
MESALRIIADSAAESRNAMIYATLIITIVSAPILFLSGVTASFFQSLAFTYVLAVFVSLVVALLVTPAFCMMLLSTTRNDNKVSAIFERQQEPYRRALGRIVQQARPLVPLLVLGALVSVAGFASLGHSLIPTFKDRNLLVRLTGAAGTSQPEMSRIDTRISTELRSVPGVLNVDTHMGRAVLGDQVVNVNSSEMWVTLDPQADYDQTIASIQKIVKGYPGLDAKVLTYMQDRTSELTAAGENTINVRIYGDRQDVLRSEAEKVKKALTGINGVKDLKLDLPGDEPSLQIEVDLAKALTYGVKPGDVRRTAAILLSGVQVGSLFEEQKVFDVVVWGTPETRRSISSINDMLIDTPSGEQVRLGDIAEVRIVPVPPVIQHDAVKRYIDIKAALAGRDHQAVATDIRSRLDQMQFPLEYHAEVRADFIGQQAASPRFLIFVGAAILIVFLLLQAAYRSWHLALLSFITVPSALAGGVLALFATGENLSLGSLIGFLVLFGIAVRNSTVMIEYIHRLERDQRLSFGPALILRAATERVNAIVLTASAVSLMLVPSLILGDVPGLETLHPMAVVVLGGLVTTTLFSLFALPALYLRFGTSREQDLEILPPTSADVPASAD